MNIERSDYHILYFEIKWIKQSMVSFLFVYAFLWTDISKKKKKVLKYTKILQKRYTSQPFFGGNKKAKLS